MRERKRDREEVGGGEVVGCQATRRCPINKAVVDSKIMEDSVAYSSMLDANCRTRPLTRMEKQARMQTLETNTKCHHCFGRRWHMPLT